MSQAACWQLLSPSFNEVKINVQALKFLVILIRVASRAKSLNKLNLERFETRGL